MTKVTLTLTLLLLSTPLLSTGQQFNYPGGIAELLIPKKSKELPTIRYGIKEPAILNYGAQWRILLGIELNQLPGEYVIYTRQNGTDEAAVFSKFEVVHKGYPLLNEPKISLVELPKYDALSELGFSNSQPPKMPMRLPFPGRWDELFGQLNMSTRSGSSLVQNYTYSTATSNTLIKAPQEGIISNIVTVENGTSTIMIDHGRGIYSILHGAVDLVVKIGNGVSAGTVIAKVPSTKVIRRRDVSDEKVRTQKAGNTHSEVFWQVQLNGVFVNPLILTKL